MYGKLNNRDLLLSKVVIPSKLHVSVGLDPSAKSRAPNITLPRGI